MSLQSGDVLRARVTSALPVVAAWADRHWKWLTFLAWVAIVASLLAIRWPSVHWFVLSDTDDNIRYVQVKDWLAGQGWFDLRQYRLDPPGGANIHWSRLVDLPLAGLMLFFHAFTSEGMADRLACAIAPMLPLLLLMLSLGFIGRRLAGPLGWIIPAFLPLAAQMGLGMFVPMRVDHHGWQLALALTMMAGLVDRDWRRGGVIAGVASALSLAIGMEMIVYLAAGGALIALRWVFRENAGQRMLPYALSLGGSTAILFLLFASYANRAMVCDALSPIWVAVFSAASAGMVLLVLLFRSVERCGLGGLGAIDPPLAGEVATRSVDGGVSPYREGDTPPSGFARPIPLTGWISGSRWPMRLGAGICVGGAVAAFFWLNWPQCLSPYQISPELERLWLVNIREAKPITAQAQSLVIPLMALPAAGLVGLLWGLWDARRDADRLWAFATVGLMMLFATALLFWQLRAGPAAQLLAIPAAAFAAQGAIRAIIIGRPWVRATGVIAVLLIAAVLFVYPLYPQINRALAAIKGDQPTPTKPAVTSRREAIRKANGRCRTLPALEVLDQLPPATIFTMVDLGPRLIATTHHSALAGPYHRNGATILDIHHAFDGPAEGFRAIAARHHATYLLVCPNFPEGTIYQSRSPRGFYAELMRGQFPKWLAPVRLRTGLTLPYQLYRIDYSAPGRKEAPQQR